MTRSPTLTERLRMERAVWLLDARLQDLPRRSRIGKRRELRQNLLAAAEAIGARRAVDRLGDQRALAAAIWPPSTASGRGGRRGSRPRPGSRRSSW